MFFLSPISDYLLSNKYPLQVNSYLQMYTHLNQSVVDLSQAARD